MKWQKNSVALKLIQTQQLERNEKEGQPQESESEPKEDDQEEINSQIDSNEEKTRDSITSN